MLQTPIDWGDARFNDTKEAANFASLPVTWDTSTLYTTLDDNKIYRWTGSVYVEVSAWTDDQTAAEVPYDNSDANLSATTTKWALDELSIEKVDAAALPSNITMYPTSVAGDFGYNRLVTDISDTDYDSPAVDISTGSITWANQLIAGIISDAWVIIWNPWVITINTIWNIKRTAGTATATFYFELYKRDIGWTETLLSTSATTVAVSSETYEQFHADLFLNNWEFIATDRFVIKFYGNDVWDWSDSTFSFQFGWTNPVRTLLPVPAAVVPWLTDAEIKTQYENNADTNAFTDAEKTKLGTAEVTTNKNQANWYAWLDAGWKVESAQLPSYVDDVIEAANFAALPWTGETWKIYVTIDDNKTFRWTGSVYIEISSSPTWAQIKALYEAEADTNAFTDAEKTKLWTFWNQSFELSQDLSAWEVVELINDWRIKEIFNTVAWTQPAGTATSASPVANISWIMCNSNTIVITYSDWTNINVRAWRIVDWVITFWAELFVDSDLIIASNTAIAKVKDNQVIVSYGLLLGSATKCKVVDISWITCTLSATAASTLIWWVAAWVSKLEYVEDDKVLCIYGDWANLSSVIITVSGSAQTVNTPLALTTGDTNRELLVFSTTEAWIVYNTWTDAKIQYIGISWTTVTNQWVDTIATDTMTVSSACLIWDHKMLIAYSTLSTNSLVVATMSWYVTTLWTAVDYVTTNDPFQLNLAKYSKDSAALYFSENSVTEAYIYNIAVSWTDITLSDRVTDEAITVTAWVDWSDIISYQDGSVIPLPGNSWASKNARIYYETPPTVVTPSWATLTTWEWSEAIKIADNKILITYMVWTTLNVAVWTVWDNSLSLWTPLEIAASWVVRFSTALSSENKVAIAYANATNLITTVVDISWTTATLGSWTSDAFSWVDALLMISLWAWRFISAYEFSNNLFIQEYLVTWSAIANVDTAISWWGVTWLFAIRWALVDTDKVLLTYSDSWTATYIRAIDTSTGPISIWSATSEAGGLFPAISKLDTNKALYSYSKATWTFTRIVTVSWTVVDTSEPAVSPNLVFNTSRVSSTSMWTNEVFLAVSQSFGWNSWTKITVTWTTISWWEVVTLTSPAHWWDVYVFPYSDKQVIEVDDNWPWSDSTFLVRDVPNRIERTAWNKLWILQASWISGETREVTLMGWISSGHTWLIPWTKYYLQANGSIWTLTTFNYVWLAISWTQLDTSEESVYWVGWKDNVASLSGANAWWLNPADWVSWIDWLYAYSFSSSVAESLHITFHILHDYKKWTNMYPHIHWSPTSTNTWTVRWWFEYAYAKWYGQEAFTTTQTIYIEQAADWVIGSHLIAEVADPWIEFPWIETDSLIHVRIFRDAAHANDTYTWEAIWLMADLHYMSDHDTTANRNGPF